MKIMFIINLSIKEWWKFVFSHENACVALSVLPLGKVYYLVLYKKSVVISVLVDGGGPRIWVLN